MSSAREDVIVEHGGKDTEESVKKNHNKYRRDKPWDTEDVDKWKIQPWDETALPGGSLLEESSFATLFPKYREKYLREVWPIVTKALDKHKIACELNLGAYNNNNNNISPSQFILFVILLTIFLFL